MRKHIVWVCLALSALVAVLGCAPPAPGEAGLGKAFTLAVGQNASVAGESLSIKFVDVVSDSRCPTGVQCIWAGEASCLVEITKSGTAYSKVLTQSGGASPAPATFAEYKIQYDLQPYPVAGKPTGKGDYRLQLTVSR